MKSKSSDTIANAFLYGINPHTRTIFLSDTPDSGIDVAMAHRLQIALDLLDEKNQTITIFFNSQGGYLYDGLAMYDAIKACQSRVVMIGRGSLMSMAPVVFQAADERILEPNTTVMLHQCTTGDIEGSLEYSIRALEEAKRVEARRQKIIADAMNITLKELKEKYSLDTYFTASQAVAVGLADKVRD